MSDAHKDKRSRQAWGWRDGSTGWWRGGSCWRWGSTRGKSSIAFGRGRLHLVMRGVYAVGWPQLTARRRWMAAVLACGDGAALSHRSAAALWGIGREQRGGSTSASDGAANSSVPGLKSQSPRETSTPPRSRRRDGIPVTEIVQTLVDLATELPPRRLERAVNEADKRDLIDPEALRARRQTTTRASPAPQRCAGCSTSAPSGSRTPTWRSSSARSRRRAGLLRRSANRSSTVGRSTSTGRSSAW